MAPERFVAFAGLAFGLLLCALTPPFGAPDEPAHLFRAWSIADGTFLVRNEGAWVPRSYVDLSAAALQRIRGTESRAMSFEVIRALGRMPLRANDRVFLRVPAQSWMNPVGYTAPSYTPVGYLAAAPAVAICRWLNAPPLVHMYAARVANTIAATLLIALAVARAPFGKWTFALSALIPMSVYVRASVSIDALVVAFAYLLIAEGLREASIAALAIDSFLVSAIKPGYALIPFTAMRRRNAAVVVTAIVAGVAASAWWAHALTGAASPRVQPILHHPATFASAFFADWRASFGIRLVEIAGVFGWLDAPVPLAFAILYFAVMLIVAIGDGPAPIGFGRRALFIAVFVASVAGITIVTHLYAPPGRFALFQGRYVLPLLPLPFLAIASDRTWRALPGICGFTVILAVAQTLWTILLRFYV